MRNDWLECERNERRGTSTGSKEAQAKMGKHPHGLAVFRISITGEEELIQDLSASFMFPNDKRRKESWRQMLKLLVKYFVISLKFPFNQSWMLLREREGETCNEKVHQNFAMKWTWITTANLNLKKSWNVRGESGNDKSKLLFYSSLSAPSAVLFECHFNFRFVTLKHATFRHRFIFTAFCRRCLFLLWSDTTFSLVKALETQINEPFFGKSQPKNWSLLIWNRFFVLSSCNRNRRHQSGFPWAICSLTKAQPREFTKAIHGLIKYQSCYRCAAS